MAQLTSRMWSANSPLTYSAISSWKSSEDGRIISWRSQQLQAAQLLMTFSNQSVWWAGNLQKRGGSACPLSSSRAAVEQWDRSIHMTMGLMTSWYWQWLKAVSDDSMCQIPQWATPYFSLGSWSRVAWLQRCSSESSFFCIRWMTTSSQKSLSMKYSCSLTSCDILIPSLIIVSLNLFIPKAIPSSIVFHHSMKKEQLGCATKNQFQRQGYTSTVVLVCMSYRRAGGSVLVAETMISGASESWLARYGLPLGLSVQSSPLTKQDLASTHIPPQ